jgi:hypothetical protein
LPFCNRKVLLGGSKICQTLITNHL